MSALQDYKCPLCGGRLEFDTKSQKLKCPYCDSEFDTKSQKLKCPYCDSEFELDEIKKISEQADSQIVQEMQEWSESEAKGMRTYSCQSCGGEIICDEHTSAASCPFCDNPVVMKGNVSDELKPDLIIPFKLDKKAAKEALIKHFSGKKLLPQIFKEENHIDEIKGVYVPFWLFDVQTEGDITYDAEKVKKWSDENFDYKEVSQFTVRRAGTLGFKNIPVKGSTKVASELMESIEPFDLSQAVEFRTEYLAGFFADKYDIEVKDCEPRVKERVKESTESALSNTISDYDSIEIRNSTVNMKSGKSKYALCPVWILNTTWNGQKYTFAMNGQTGKFVGNLPMDSGAYWKWFGITGGCAAVVTYIITAFFM